MDAARSLERLASDVEEIEFTVEDGTLAVAADAGGGAVGAGGRCGWRCNCETRG